MRTAWLLLTTGCVSFGTPHYFAFPGGRRAPPPEPITVSSPPLLSAERAGAPCDGSNGTCTAQLATAADPRACTSSQADCGFDAPALTGTSPAGTAKGSGAAPGSSPTAAIGSAPSNAPNNPHSAAGGHSRASTPAPEAA